MYQSIIELANDGILVFNDRLQVEYANRAISQITGYDHARIMGMNIARLLGDKSRALLEDIFSHPETYGEKTCTEIQFSTAAGNIRYAEICIALSIPSDGSDKANAYIRDITDQKRIENELREANEFFQNLISSSVDGIIAADMKGNIFIFNQAAEQLTGYSADEVIGKVHITQLYPEGVASDIMKKLRSSNNGGVGKLNPSQLNLISKTGEKIPFQLSATLIYDGTGSEIASVGIFTDLRKRLDMERKLQETHMQLVSSEKLASLGKLAAGIAHEINNPLGGILIYASLMIEDIPDDDPKRQDLVRIVQEAGRCKDIVKSLLEFARQNEPTMEPVDINRAITEGLFFLENQALFHNIKIVKKLLPSLPFARGNAGQLKQVFMNIIVNAAEAMHGNGTLTISTSFNQERKHIAIEFTDTGEGIPEENLTRIFDPFFTTKEIGKGTGLGLSTSYGIIEAHGSKIEVRSKVGVGSTFAILLAPYPEIQPIIENSLNNVLGTLGKHDRFEDVKGHHEQTQHPPL
ncbi:MAG: PAS domain S-box protein [Deltaproteobacteria bacterium]|nr:PAS domain S-box protein [Deltaproteobacteria bacterium]